MLISLPLSKPRKIMVQYSFERARKDGEHSGIAKTNTEYCLESRMGNCF